MSRFIPCKNKKLYAHEKFAGQIFIYQEEMRQEEACSLRDLTKEGVFHLLFCETDSEESDVMAWLSVLTGKSVSSISFERDRNLHSMLLDRIDGESFCRRGTTVFSMKNYALEIGAGGTVQVCGGEGQEYLSLKGGYSFYRLVGFFCSGRELRLEMEENAGCFSFSIDGLTTLKRMGVFLSFTKEVDSSLKRARIQPLSPQSVPFCLPVLLDVLHPEERKRSFFTLPAGLYDTAFPTAMGNNLVLELQREGDAVLVFSGERRYQKNHALSYTLVPEGSFQIVSGAGDLLTGSSGLEYIRFDKESTLFFRSGQASHFALDKKEPDTSGRTSYLSLEGTYYAQGQEAAFFTQEKGMEYNFLEIPFCRVGESVSVPVLPLGLTDDGFRQEQPENLEEVDTECLQPFRGELLSTAEDISVLKEEARRAINERGTVISYASGSESLSCLELGDMFRFANVRGRLKKALLCARPFLVAADGEAFLKEADFIAEEPLFEIEGWQFDFSPEKWSENTVLVIKYNAGKSIAEYAQEVSEWSYPAGEKERARAAEVLKERLKSFPEEEQSLFYDRNWCGVVLLEMPVASSCLPSEIRFLTNVGKPPELTLQYMAFDQRTVSETGEILPSGVSGCIHYENTNYGAPDRQYDFFYRLNLLHVLFENSALCDFYCEMSVALFYLFGSPLAVPDSDTGNFIPIRGWRNRETDAEDTARFSFAVKEEREYRFFGSAIERMVVDGAKLLASEKGNRVNFYFSGGIYFERYESDLFSFGDEQDGEEGKETHCPLKFLDLEVDVEGEEYAGSSANMKFLSSESRARRNSLGQSFALEAKKLGLFCGIPPEKLGYEGISADGITQKELEKDWVGLEFDVDLGGMGALAGTADIRLHLLFAWSAGEKNKSYDGGISVGPPKLYVGVRLGELSGTAQTLPIQGMMSLGVEAVELKKNTVTSPEGETEEVFYFLLKDFVLKFFGLQFPYGSNCLYVFGNSGGETAEPKSDQGTKKLAFYGAYERK